MDPAHPLYGSRLPVVRRTTTWRKHHLVVRLPNGRTRAIPLAAIEPHSPLAAETPVLWPRRPDQIVPAPLVGYRRGASMVMNPAPLYLVASTGNLIEPSNPTLTPITESLREDLKLIADVVDSLKIKWTPSLGQPERKISSDAWWLTGSSGYQG